jgi:hypothetical protein
MALETDLNRIRAWFQPKPQEEAFRSVFPEKKLVVDSQVAVPVEQMDLADLADPVVEGLKPRFFNEMKRMKLDSVRDERVWYPTDARGEPCFWLSSDYATLLKEVSNLLRERGVDFDGFVVIDHQNPERDDETMQLRTAKMNGSQTSVTVSSDHLLVLPYTRRVIQCTPDPRVGFNPTVLR